MKQSIKAISLFSGGLDSLLAIKVIQSQGIDVIAVAFRSPFFISDEKKKEKLEQIAKSHKFKVKFIELGNDYFELVRNPKHGHGKNINPCIDCHAFMIRKAKNYAKKIGAKFVFTGEVLDERPMSHNMGSLSVVEKEAGLKGKLLRPLSAKLLPETEAEKKGFVDRKRLLGFRGRSRKPQFELARKFRIKEYETPGGGCLLTYEAYANKLRDLFKYCEKVSKNDIYLLKTGRHFRFKDNKIIVGRSEEDNNNILKLKSKSYLVFEAKDYVGPTTILTGEPSKKTIELAASITARYSDAEDDSVLVRYGSKKLDKEILVNKISNTELEKLRV